MDELGRLRASRVRPSSSGERGDPCDVFADVGLALETRSVHVADVAEDRALGPRPVVKAKYPTDVRIRICIAAVEEIAVVEVQERRVPDLPRGRPLQPFLPQYIRM